jgi:glycosyltransferase involved in cell wall biosynthesis
MRTTIGAAAARRCRLLVAQNHEEASLLEAHGPPVTVRPNVFLAESFFDDSGMMADDRGPDRSTSKHQAVFAGRLVAWKGVHLAIATMSRPEMADWHLDVFGTGPERRRLEHEIRDLGLSDRVFLRGKRPRQEVRLAMCRADAFFFPSMREAAGWVVAEALAVGCPVICVDTAGPPLLLGGAGCAVPPGPDIALDLAKALSSTLTMPRHIVRWDQHAIGPLLEDWYRSATTPGVPADTASIPQ